MRDALVTLASCGFTLFVGRAGYRGLLKVLDF